MTADPAPWGEPESAVPVGPEDCGLCLAIPLTRDEVLRHLAEPQRFGYVPGIASGRAVTAAFVNELWQFYSSQVVVPVEALCKKLGRLKVEVRRGADLGDVSETARLRRVVLLWTHWEAPAFLDEEITDPEEFVRSAESGTSWVCREVREALRPRRYWGLSKGDFLAAVEGARAGGRLGPFVASALNHAIERARAARDASFRRALGNGSAGSMPVGPTSAPLVTRVLVERDFQPAVGLGRCVETSGGMATAWALLAHVPADRRFVLDLTICNSTEFAELARTDRPGVRVIGHGFAADVVSGALLVARTIDLLAEQPRPYLLARALAVNELRSRIRGVR
jgi:hypothetical protein